MRRPTFPPLDLRHLRYFVTVAEELHFGRAAARLGISQPPLSESVRRLEDAIGAQLLERTRRRVALTSVGRVLYGEAVKLLAHAERVQEVMQDVRSGRRGELFVGCVPMALFGALPAIMEAGRGMLGALQVRVTEAHTADIILAVLDGRLDAGLVWEDRAPAPLALRPLQRVKFIVALHRSHRLAGKRHVALADLAQEPLILSPREVTPHQFDRIVSMFRQADLSPRIGQQARSIAAQLGFVASGLGYAIVPEHAATLAVAGVEFRPLREVFASTPLSLVWNEARVPPYLVSFRQAVDAAFAAGKRGNKARA